jgi:electron transport complex protein RnfG
MSDIVKMIVVLTAICLLSAFALTALRNGLEARIVQQEEFYVLGPAVNELLPDATNDPVAQAFSAEVDGETWRMYPWLENGKCRAVAVRSTGKGGYGGDVQLLTAFDLQTSKILGVRVTAHQETPGVGSRAADPSYLRVYAGRGISPGTQIALKKNGGEIDAVSGATFTSTAVADGVNRATQFVLAHKDEISGWALAKQSAS